MLKGWIKKSGLLPKVFMAIAITIPSLYAYRMWLGPYVKRQRHKEAEAWAATIIEHEDEQLIRE